jgi:large subunit ribosomal protein L9
MEIILQEDFPLLGYIGDRIAVKRGFARNYLLPRGIAIEVSSRNANILRHHVDAINAKKAKAKVAAEDLGKQIAAIQLQFTLKVGKQGKSFGSISLRDIEVELEKVGQKLDRKRIRLAEPIKRPGEYTVDVKLHSEVVVPVKVVVSAEHIVEKEEGVTAEKGKERKGRGRKRTAVKEDAVPEDAAVSEAKTSVTDA